MFAVVDLPMVISVIAVFVATLSLIFESRRSHFSTMVDLLLKLEDRFHSPDMKRFRADGAKKLLLSKKDNYELEMVLEELSSISFLYVRKAIDTKLTYVLFAYWIDRYWLAGEEYIKEVRKTDHMSYATLESVARSFIKKERKDGYNFSDDYLKLFLEEEKRHKSQRGSNK